MEKVFLLNVFIASLIAVGLEEFLKNFFKPKNTVYYALLMLPLAVGSYLCVGLLPPYIAGCLLTVGAVQLCYQSLVQGFKAIIENLTRKMQGEGGTGESVKLDNTMIYKQAIAKKIGDEGCYFLSLVYIAEQEIKKSIDIIDLYNTCVAKGWMKEDCYILDPAAILSYLIGKKTMFFKVDGTKFTPTKFERVISRYENNARGKLYSHFVVGCNGKVIYDPLGESNTVKNGKLVSYRVFSFA